MPCLFTFAADKSGATRRYAALPFDMFAPMLPCCHDITVKMLDAAIDYLFAAALFTLRRLWMLYHALAVIPLSHYHDVSLLSPE